MAKKKRAPPKDKDVKRKGPRWSNSSPAGILLTELVNSDKIYDRMPSNVAMRESDLFEEYPPKAFSAALRRARQAKKQAKKNKAHFGTSASLSTYTPCSAIMIFLKLNLNVLYSIFLVSDQETGKDKDKKKMNDYPDLSDSDDCDTSKGGEEEYSSMETDELEEKMPPRKTRSVKKSLLQV